MDMIAQKFLSRTMSDLAQNSDDRRAVGLIHGLGRGPGSMTLMANRLEAAGFRTFLMHYRSRHVVPAEAQADLVQQLDALSPGPCDLVGHSLGGVLALRIKIAQPDRIGRVVQLGPPNLGSPMAAFFRDYRLVADLMGPALERLAAADMGLDHLPPEVARDLGIIAGSAPIGPVSGFWGLAEPSDGMVPVSSALGIDHADALITRTVHGMLPLSMSAARQTAAFLRNGRFDTEKSA